MNKQRRHILLSTAGGCAAATLMSSAASAKTPATAPVKSLSEVKGIDFDARARESVLAARPEGVTSREGVCVSFATCFGCTTQCGVRLHHSPDGKTLFTLGGNPYHPLSSIAPLSMQTPLSQAIAATSLTAEHPVRATLCARGRATADAIASPHRVLKPLKRVGPRGSGRYRTIEWSQLIDEIVKGGNLFGEGHVEGLASLRDTKTPIDASRPELGPRVNQLGLITSVNDGRDAFARRFWNQALGSINYVGHGSWCGGSYRSGSGALFGDFKKMPHGKPDFESARFVIFEGTSPAQAGNPFKRTAEWVAERRASGNFEYVVVEPVMTQSVTDAPEKGSEWIGVRPGSDSAFAGALARILIEEKLVNADFLSHPNLEAARKAGHAAFSSAAFLVYDDPAHPRFGHYVRAGEVKLAGAKPDDYVVATAKGLAAAQTIESAPFDVERKAEGGLPAMASAFALMRRKLYEKTVADYAKLCGVPAEKLTALARKFASFGTKASAVGHGGFMSGAGFYGAYTLLSLNVLVGSVNRQGGFAMSGGTFNGTQKGPRYNLAAFEGQVKPRGIPLGRNVPFEKTSDFKKSGVKAARDLWFPNAPGLGTEWFASTSTGYPYALKALFIWMANPIYGMPGMRRYVEKVLKDPAKIPLIVAVDAFVNESGAFADYVVPDTHMYETWGFNAPWGGVPTKVCGARWPVLESRCDKTPEGEAMGMESFFIALARAMKLPGFGKGVIEAADKRRVDLLKASDFYLRAAANIAYLGEKPLQPVEAETLKMSGLSRIMPTVRAALTAEEAERVATLYARGGRFEPVESAHAAGDAMKQSYKAPLWLYNEALGTSTNALTGRRNGGTPGYLAPSFADGTPMRDVYKEKDWPFELVSFKSVLLTSYGAGSRLSRLKSENPILVHDEDARTLGVKTGDRVRVTTPGGQLVATVLTTRGIVRGVVAFEHGFGHRDLGARALEIDGKTVPALARAAGGVQLNDIGIADPTRPSRAPWVDAVSGASVRNGLPAKLERIA